MVNVFLVRLIVWKIYNFEAFVPKVVGSGEREWKAKFSKVSRSGAFWECFFI